MTLAKIPETVIEQNQDLILAPWSFFRILNREVGIINNFHLYVK
jgi:hypothetical protein